MPVWCKVPLLLVLFALWPETVLWLAGAVGVLMTSYGLWMLQPEDRRRLW